MNEPFLVHHLLEGAAERSADAPALYHLGQWLTYGALDRQANAVASFCVAHGLAPGDRVIILFENSCAYVAAYFGVLKAGGVAVALSSETNAEGLSSLLRHSEARAVIVGRRFAAVLDGAGDACRDLLFCLAEGGRPTEPGRYDLESIVARGDCVNPRVSRIDLDLESIVYTSGSTGEPKGVMLSHLNTISNMRSIVAYLGLQASDRIMVVLPFSYIYGKSLLLTHFLVGGSVVIDNRFMYPNVVIDTMISTGVTGFAGVPSTFSILLARSRIREARIPSLRSVTQAGGAMPAAVQQQVSEVFHPARLYVMYGATEAAPRLTYVDPADLPSKWGSIGKAVPNVEVFVADDEGNRLGPGEVGEIVARGSNIMMGYWKDPDGTAEALRSGVYFTGDLGKADADGFLYVVGRKRDIIKVRGYRVSAKTIEEAIAGVPEVQEVAVTGVPDKVLGESVWAFVVAKPGMVIDEQRVRQYLSTRLRPYEVPKVIECREELPKNESGKVMKNRLSPGGGVQKSRE